MKQMNVISKEVGVYLAVKVALLRNEKRIKLVNHLKRKICYQIAIPIVTADNNDYFVPIK